MLCDASTLANVPRLLAETLRCDYDIDAAPLLESVGIDSNTFFRPGARVPYRKMQKLWALAIDTTGDPLFGFRVGERSTASDFYLLGHSWLSSGTLFDALERLSRYIDVLSNIPTHMRVQRSDETVMLIESFPDQNYVPHRAASEAGYVALIKLCQAICRRPVHPVNAELIVARNENSAAYDRLFCCPVVYGADEEKIFFARDVADEPLPGSIPEILDASTEIADRYLESLDSSSVSAEVRRQIMQLLPSGHADQSTVAQKLYRSRSTLQRQLYAEGTSFRHILDTTRRGMAERYLRAGELSLAEVAYLTGFTDQSNFSRAFKRWVGATPGEFQRVPQPTETADAR